MKNQHSMIALDDESDVSLQRARNIFSSTLSKKYQISATPRRDDAQPPRETALLISGTAAEKFRGNSK